MSCSGSSKGSSGLIPSRIVGLVLSALLASSLSIFLLLVLVIFLGGWGGEGCEREGDEGGLSARWFGNSIRICRRVSSLTCRKFLYQQVFLNSRGCHPASTVKNAVGCLPVAGTVKAGSPDATLT